MHKFLSLLFLMCLAILNTLGNFWYTYGIWPKSWQSFTLFAITGVIIGNLLAVGLKAKE